METWLLTPRLLSHLGSCSHCSHQHQADRVPRTVVNLKCLVTTVQHEGQSALPLAHFNLGYELPLKSAEGVWWQDFYPDVLTTTLLSTLIRNLCVKTGVSLKLSYAKMPSNSEEKWKNKKITGSSIPYLFCHV